MNLTVVPSELRGTVVPPPSKSQTHRLLIAAALAEGDSRVSNAARSKDVEATVRCLRELGAEIDRSGDALAVRGMGAGAASSRRRLALPRLDCGESGSTLRFLIPVALAVRGGGSFTGSGRLMERPQGPYFDLFREKGVFFERKGDALTVQGTLPPGEYRLPGDVSSQFFTGLLFALPLLPGPSVLIPTTRLESSGYIRMTLDAMGRFGVDLPAGASLPPRYRIPGSQTYRAAGARAEGDWSQAAFWYAARFLGCAVEVLGLRDGSLQADAAIGPYLREMEREREVSLDVSGCPDLAPPLAAAAAGRAGTTVLTGTRRLRIKESDRSRAICETLTALGAGAEEREDSIVLRGRESLPGGCAVDCRNDHRIAMMAAVAAVRCREPVTLRGAQCVEKSYPRFWEDYRSLGGDIHEHAGE